MNFPVYPWQLQQGQSQLKQVLLTLCQPLQREALCLPPPWLQMEIWVRWKLEKAPAGYPS